MLDFLKVIILGIVEGITEYLPISSTGHLILVGRWVNFGGDDFTNLFDIFIQIGAIFAVIILYFSRLMPLKQGRRGGKIRIDQKAVSIWGYVIVAFIPAILFSLLFYDKIQELLFNPITVSISLILGGIVILYIERSKMKTLPVTPVNFGFKRAFIVGLFQCISMIPGVSRSAATIIGARLCGADRKNAAEFSFFLAVPTICGASVYSLAKAVLETGITITPTQWIYLLLGCLVSFVVAILVIKAFLGYIQKKSFSVFGWYRIALGVIVLALSFAL